MSSALINESAVVMAVLVEQLCPFWLWLLESIQQRIGVQLATERHQV